jgi:hypothetical protein
MSVESDRDYEMARQIMLRMVEDMHLDTLSIGGVILSMVSIFDRFCRDQPTPTLMNAWREALRKTERTK